MGAVGEETTVLQKGPSLPQAEAAGAGGGVPVKVCVCGGTGYYEKGTSPRGLCVGQDDVPHSLINVYGQEGLGLGVPGA